MVCLKNETILYKHVNLRNLPNHLGTTSTGVDVINVIGLQQERLSWWVEDTRVSEFIARCEEAQRKAMQAGLAILDAWIVAVVSRSFLSEKISPYKQLNFKGLP